MADQKTVIPAGPWTEEILGKELYETLAVEYGCGRPEARYRPALDLTEAFERQQAEASKPAQAKKDGE